MRSRHVESHLVDRIGWLRAAALGANDGIISTASLIVGVASAVNSTNEVLITGIAGWWRAPCQWRLANMFQ
jgi:vacuolar iron transporter family protein